MRLDFWTPNKNIGSGLQHAELGFRKLDRLVTQKLTRIVSRKSEIRRWWLSCFFEFYTAMTFDGNMIGMTFLRFETKDLKRNFKLKIEKCVSFAFPRKIFQKIEGKFRKHLSTILLIDCLNNVS